MIKSIIKEIFIILLLIVAITLGLGILFYDDNPTTKKIPSAIEAYVLPDDMETELKESIDALEKQTIIKTYSVTAEDLDRYQATEEYETGKINPFGAISSNSNTTNKTPGNFLNTVK